MDYKIQGKLALINAGAHGIGESIADLLTQEGASVIVADSDVDSTRNISWFTEYGHYFPGEFIKQATPGRNLNYWTGWLDIRY